MTPSSTAPRCSPSPGRPTTTCMGMRYQQEVNLLQLFSDVAVFNQQVMGPAHAHALVDAACRTALAVKGVAHINCCNDWQEKSTSDEALSAANIKGHTSKAWTPPIVVPQARVARRAPRRCSTAARRRSSSPARGRWGPGRSSNRSPTRWARRSSRPCWARRSSPTIPRITTGGIGLLGTLPSELAMEECDTLLIAGSSFPYMQYLPEPDQAKAVQIDRDPTRIGLRYPIDIGLTGDAKATLQALLPMLQRRQDRSFLETAQSAHEGMVGADEQPRGARRRAAQAAVHRRHVNDLLADDAIITTDSGTITTWAARHIKIRRGMKFSCSGNLATMAPGLPYANGAQIAFPDRQVVAFVGDGGFTMLMMEFVTAVKHNLPIKVIIIKNNTLGQIKWEQMVFLGNPEYGVELQPIDFVKFAEACGGVGFRCEKPDEVRPALEAAFASKKPALVEAVVDPFEPPQPARATFKQGLHMAEALARGEPHRGQIALTLFRDKMKEWF